MVVTQRSLIEVNEGSDIWEAIVTLLGVHLIKRSGSRRRDTRREPRNRTCLRPCQGPFPPRADLHTGPNEGLMWGKLSSSRRPPWGRFPLD